MIYGQNEYGQVPPILKQFITEKADHEYIPKKDDSVLQTISHDHNITAFNIASRVLKGAAIGFAASFFGYFNKVADKKLLTDRVHQDRRMYLLRRAKVNIVIGGLVGLGWYFIHDQLLCGHGQATFTRNILAHAAAGSLLYAAFWNPSNFFIGAVVGVLFGIKNEYISVRPFPKDLQIQFGPVNEEARRRAIHDERQLDLSYKLIAAAPSFKNHFAL